MELIGGVYVEQVYTMMDLHRKTMYGLQQSTFKEVYVTMKKIIAALAAIMMFVPAFSLAEEAAPAAADEPAAMAEAEAVEDEVGDELNAEAEEGGWYELSEDGTVLTARLPMMNSEDGYEWSFEAEDGSPLELLTSETTTDEDGSSVTETHTLGEFATRTTSAGFVSIARENGSRKMSVTSETLDGYNTTLLSREVEPKLAALDLPDGVTAELAGETTQVAEMLQQMVLMMTLALIFVYFVMVAQFQSLLSPFIVLFTIPLAFTGGMLGLMIAGEQLSLISLMGFLVLMGVVVNNGIVFVDYANQLRIGGLERTDALVATGRTRMRPILMTTLTTVLAMVTMLFSQDVGSDMSKGMAIVIIGGLTYATLMTLFIVPVMYDLLYRKPPVNIDVGDDGMDDLPDDAAEFAAEFAARRAGAAQPAADAEAEPTFETTLLPPKEDAK